MATVVGTKSWSHDCPPGPHAPWSGEQGAWVRELCLEATSPGVPCSKHLTHRLASVSTGCPPSAPVADHLGTPLRNSPGNRGQVAALWSPPISNNPTAATHTRCLRSKETNGRPRNCRPPMGGVGKPTQGKCNILSAFCLFGTSSRFRTFYF